MRTFEIFTLEEMCMVMCDNRVPKRFDPQCVQRHEEAEEEVRGEEDE